MAGDLDLLAIFLTIHLRIETFRACGCALRYDSPTFGLLLLNCRRPEYLGYARDDRIIATPFNRSLLSSMQAM